MNWLTVILNITFTSIAILLCVLGYSTLKRIKHLNMGKSFWIPVFVSGLLFSIGSITTILNEVGLSLTITTEIVQITQVIALCLLSGGIYGYSSSIRKNLSEKYTVPETIPAPDSKIEVDITPKLSVDKKTITPNNLRIEPASGCNHQLGYLRTFPINSALPGECLSCEKIIECKHP